MSSGGRKIREWIIRRLGGVPIWIIGRDPFPDWFLRVRSSEIRQSWDGIRMTVEYDVMSPEDRKGRANE